MRFTKRFVAVALGLVALAGPAVAAGGYTVTANGNTSGDWAFSAYSGGLAFTIHHGTTNQVMSCSDVTFGGVVQAGTNITQVWTATSSTWNSCSFNNQPVTVTPNSSSSFFTPTGPATTGTDDHIAGSLGADLDFSALGGTCTFTVVGPANATFNENNGVNQTITADETVGNLKVSGVSLGCFGVVANGDPVDMVTGPTTSILLGGAAAPTYLS